MNIPAGGKRVVLSESKYLWHTSMAEQLPTLLDTLAQREAKLLLHFC
jgi:hypothetical protein